MTEYDPHADALGSWQDAIAAIREKYRDKVRELRPLLVRARRALRLARPLVARAIGVSTSCLQAWENGEHDPAPDMLDRWRAYLRIDVVG